MLAVQSKTFRYFDGALVAANGLFVIVYAVLFLTKNLDTTQLGVSLYATSQGIVHLIYFGTLYRAFRKRSVVGASLIGAGLFVANLALIITITGGLGSAYYALWLLCVLATGIYRPSVPLALIALTTLYFIGTLLTGTANSAIVSTAAITLGATYVTGGLGFWLWHTHHTRYKDNEDVEEITEQLSTEQVKSEVLIDQVGEGVLVVDKELRVSLLNPAGVNLTGWPAAEARGIDQSLVLTLETEQGQQLTGEDNVIKQAILTKKVIVRDDLILTTRSHKKMALSTTVSPIYDNEGKSSGAIAIFRDVSQAKSTERQRNEFISTASHEMRTPVAAVEGYISLALNPKVATIDEPARKYLLKAQASTQHLGKLFQDLLAITRIEEGKLPSHPEVVDTSNLIEQVIDELRFKAQKKSLKLGFNSIQQTSAVKNLSPLYYVYADPERLREVLINLADNAIKFTDKGGVEITLDGNDKEVIMGVKDSGHGIAPEDIAHLFQKFYRIENSATANIGGTGLGLYISRAIVEMYEGRIWVESAPGRGSHFKFSIPRLSYDRAMSLEKPPSASPTAPPKPVQPSTPNSNHKNFVATSA